jgi:hypothetical protein
MTVFWTDNQVVGETESTLLTTKGVTQFSITLKNSGVNTMNYRFQEYNGTAWVDLALSARTITTRFPPTRFARSW